MAHPIDTSSSVAIHPKIKATLDELLLRFDTLMALLFAQAYVDCPIDYSYIKLDQPSADAHTKGARRFLLSRCRAEPGRCGILKRHNNQHYCCYPSKPMQKRCPHAECGHLLTRPSFDVACTPDFAHATANPFTHHASR